MIKNFWKILLLTTFLFISSHSLSFAGTINGIDVNLQVGECNYNGICEPGEEDMYSCPTDCLPTPEEEDDDRKEGSFVLDYFKDLTIEVGYDKAIIRWKSNVPTISSLKWGTNPDYKDGVIKNVNYLMNHRVEITGLSDGTIYYFSIESQNYFGILKSIDNQIFQTLFLPDTTPPDNPTNIKISSGPQGITITWKNPENPDFDYIRIMRFEDRYYASPFLGKLVYEGRGNYFTDTDVKEGVKYFYVLFARDASGNYSSGSLASIIHNPKGLDNIGEGLPLREGEVEFPEGVSFLVIQNDTIHNFYPGDEFNLNGDDDIAIKTNYFSKIKNDDLWIEIRNSKGIILGQYFFERKRDENNFIKVEIPYFEKGDYYHIFVYRYRDGVSHLLNHGWFDIKKASEVGSSIISYKYIFMIILPLLLLILLFILILRKIIKKIRNKIK